MAFPAEVRDGKCYCHRCLRERDERVSWGGTFSLPFASTRMIVCPKCGNKRCPRASDHRLDCADSNDPGQSGSIYGTPE